MRAIDCVVFDIGNVLIRWDSRNLFREMGYAGSDIDTMYAETHLREINHRVLDAGGSFEETLHVLAGHFPQYAPLLRAFDTRWTEMLDGPIDANVNVLDELRRRGVPVHAISNFNDEKFDLARGIFPFLDSFDHSVISGYIGLVKPDREIFEYWRRTTGMDARRAVFIDDSAANIDTARQLGFHTVHFVEGETDFRAELVKFDVLPAGD
jgi:2-haloacid dehalogenase